MANIAMNEVMITFKKGISMGEKQEVVDYISENLVYDDIYNDPDVWNDDSNCMELSYGTKWSERQETLQEICNKFNVTILGVCYEWGCEYVNSFDLSKEETDG